MGKRVCFEVDEEDYKYIKNKYSNDEDIVCDDDVCYMDDDE